MGSPDDTLRSPSVSLPVGAVPADRWQPSDFARVADDELAVLAGADVLENAAYFELWRRHHAFVSEMVHSRLNGQDAEHTVTTFFCHKLPRVLHQYTPRAGGRSFEAWLKRVLTNYLNDEWRRNRSRRSREVHFGADLSDVAERSTACAVPPRVEADSDRQHLVFFLSQIMQAILEPVDRHIFRARYWEDKAMKEIALELDLSEANVRIRHWRAKKRLYAVCKAYRDAGIL